MSASYEPFSEQDLSVLKDRAKFESSGGWHVVSRLIDELRSERENTVYIQNTKEGLEAALSRAHMREDHAKVSALPLEVLDSHVEYLISMGTREGLLIAQDLNDRFGRSARKRAGIND